MAMRLTKAERERVRAMYGGRCAYCGCDLPQRWHADHVEPVVRNDWLPPPQYAHMVGMATPSPMQRPENDRIGNMRPACPQCNISKGSMSLETWRKWLAGHLRSLNQHHSIYRLCKAFGLLVETGAAIRFYFERAQPEPEGDR
jgi:hypothetical protein